MSTIALSVPSRFPLADALAVSGIVPCDTAAVLAYRKKVAREYRLLERRLTDEEFTLLRTRGIGLHACLIGCIGYLLWGLPGLCAVVFPPVCHFLTKWGVEWKAHVHGWSYARPGIVLTGFLYFAAGHWFPNLADHLCRPRTQIRSRSIFATRSSSNILAYFAALIEERCPDAQSSLDEFIGDSGTKRFLVVVLGKEKFYIPEPKDDD